MLNGRTLENPVGYRVYLIPQIKGERAHAKGPNSGRLVYILRFTITQPKLRSDKANQERPKVHLTGVLRPLLTPAELTNHA